MQGMESYTPPIATSYTSYCQVAFSVSSYYCHWLYYLFRSFHGENARNVNLCRLNWLSRNFVCQKLSWLRQIWKRSIITFQPPMLFLRSKMYTIIILHNSKIFCLLVGLCVWLYQNIVFPLALIKLMLTIVFFWTTEHWTLKINFLLLLRHNYSEIHYDYEYI